MHELDVRRGFPSYLTPRLSKSDAMGIELQSQVHNCIFFKEFGCTVCHMTRIWFLGRRLWIQGNGSRGRLPKALYLVTLYKKTRYKVTKAIQNLVTVDPEF